VEVVVAAQDIPERTLIQPSMVTKREWPSTILPPGAHTRLDEVVGKYTLTRIVAGEVILPGRISEARETGEVALTIPPGLVAVALPVSTVSGVGGALRPGDRVDVMISLDIQMYDASGDKSEPQFTTLYTIQDVPVLRVSGVGEAGSSARPAQGQQQAATAQAGAGVLGSVTTLTLLVTPQDALLLKYARERGTIDLALRSPSFHDQVVTDPVYLDYIITRFQLPTPPIVHKK
jgi:pilus assembly protein CpaB